MIYFITKSGRDAGSSRQRGFLMAEFLNKAGFPAEVIAPPEYLAGTTLFQKWGMQWRYTRKILSIKKTDTVVLQNIIRNIRLIMLVAVLKTFRHPRTIFDIDDGSYMRNPWIVKTLVALSDKIVVASHRLAEWPGFQKKPIHIMPNPVDAELAARFSAKEKGGEKNGGDVVVGWIGGGPGSIPNLKLLVPIFQRLVAQKISFRFRFIGTLGNVRVEELFSSIPGLNAELVEKIDWAKLGEIQKANAVFDIGVCPLVDNEESRVRCSLKVLDYMAAGIPVVISPIGENNYFIKNGEQGFLPATLDEWAEKLTLLIKDAALRQRLGAAGQKRVAEKFSYQAQVPGFANFIFH